jgi:hypothetical protein
MTEYVHGYGTPEQERLVEQAEHWRHRLIRDGTKLEPWTRLLEVGCGAGAVLAVLGQEFPGVRLTARTMVPSRRLRRKPRLWGGGVLGVTWPVPTKIQRSLLEAGRAVARTRRLWVPNIRFSPGRHLIREGGGS